MLVGISTLSLTLAIGQKSGRCVHPILCALYKAKEEIERCYCLHLMIVYCSSILIRVLIILVINYVQEKAFRMLVRNAWLYSEGEEKKTCLF